MIEERDYKQYMSKAEFEKSVNTLIGILNGIHADEIIHQSEIEELQNWCLLQYTFKEKYPYKEILPIIENSISDGILTKDEIDDIRFVISNYMDDSPYFDVVTQDIQKLHGILHGIISDNKITDDELRYLKDWLDDNSHLESTFPYDEIYSLTHSILKDGKVDEIEEKYLMAFFSDFMDSTASANISSIDIENIKNEMTVNGICALAPNIEIEGKTFCFTGEFSRAKRSEIAELITSRGGIFNKNVVKTTDFLIVGDEGNQCWAFACYGRKIEAAMKARKNGQKLVIAHEIDFWDAMND